MSLGFWVAMFICALMLAIVIGVAVDEKKNVKVVSEVTGVGKIVRFIEGINSGYVYTDGEIPHNYMTNPNTVFVFASGKKYAIETYCNDYKDRVGEQVKITIFTRYRKEKFYDEFAEIVED